MPIFIGREAITANRKGLYALVAATQLDFGLFHVHRLGPSAFNLPTSDQGNKQETDADGHDPVMPLSCGLALSGDALLVAHARGPCLTTASKTAAAAPGQR